MKYSKEVAKLITKLREEGVNPPSTPKEVNCQGCNCPPQEHTKYIYCPVIEGYLCHVCCSYELCNDYELTNSILGKEVFSSDLEVINICKNYCSAEEFIINNTKCERP
ncbi:hypothetical protein JCM16358_26290 [Halanaerocella petrolearia]